MIGKLDRIPRTIIVLPDGIVLLQQRVLLQERHSSGIVETRTEVVERGDGSIVALAVLTLLARKQERVAARRHARLFPLLTEGIVILAIEIDSACRRNLRHNTRAAQMIRQEVMRRGRISCRDQPPPAEWPLRRRCCNIPKNRIFVTLKYELSSLLINTNYQNLAQHQIMMEMRLSLFDI